MQEDIIQEIDKKFCEYFSSIPIKKLALIKEGVPLKFHTEFDSETGHRITKDWEDAPQLWVDACRFVHRELLSYWDDEKMANPIAQAFADKYALTGSSPDTTLKYINDVLIKAN